jgi:cell pole-organizing protein PopZ
VKIKKNDAAVSAATTDIGSFLRLAQENAAVIAGSENVDEKKDEKRDEKGDKKSGEKEGVKPSLVHEQTIDVKTSGDDKAQSINDEQLLSEKTPVSKQAQGKFSEGRIETSISLMADNLFSDQIEAVVDNYRSGDDTNVDIEKIVNSGNIAAEKMGMAEKVGKNGEKNNRGKAEDTLSVAVSDALKDLASPMIKKWINENLSTIVGKVVETEVKKILGNSNK